MNSFDRDGISFNYPENWTTDSDDSENGGWTFSAMSPETAFVLVSLRPDVRDPADLADQTLDALRADYRELDAENRVETIAGRMAIGHEIDFLTVDTAITCQTRCFDSAAGPVLVMCQSSEYDRETNGPVLQAIVASMKVETD